MTQKLDLIQETILSGKMIQSMEILQMGTIDLENYVKELAMENPVIDFLETDSTDEIVFEKEAELRRKLEWLETVDSQNQVYYKQDYNEEWNFNVGESEDLTDHLFSQLITPEMSKTEKEVYNYIVLSLDENGYLKESAEFIADELHVKEELVRKAIKRIQSLEPAGIAAKNLQECLHIQLDRKKSYSPYTVIIVDNYLKQMGKNHLCDIARKLKISLEDVEKACDEIRQLNPKPGNNYSNGGNLHYIRPDVLVENTEGSFNILLKEYPLSKFSINSYYISLCRETENKEVASYLNDKIKQAEWLSQCITQRNSTLAQVTRIIIEKQKRFFIRGAAYKGPLKLSDIAEELNLSESTVSRALKDKFLQCAWGIYPMNWFLATAVCEEWELTADHIKQWIQRIIYFEDKKKPYSDREIAEELETYSINISRRTVAKYREELNIPDKSGRKYWERKLS